MSSPWPEREEAMAEFRLLSEHEQRRRERWAVYAVATAHRLGHSDLGVVRDAVLRDGASGEAVAEVIRLIGDFEELGKKMGEEEIFAQLRASYPHELVEAFETVCAVIEPMNR